MCILEIDTRKCGANWQASNYTFPKEVYTFADQFPMDFGSRYPFDLNI
jgi:hypothetical protein